MQKMVLLGPEKGTGVPVRHWRPERSPGVMVPANVMPAMDDGIGMRCRRGLTNPATARAVREQKDRSCAGKTTERGAETCLTGCREAVITNVARFRAPADLSCESEGIGDLHGQATGRKRSRERGGVGGRE